MRASFVRPEGYQRRMRMVEKETTVEEMRLLRAERFACKNKLY